MESPAKDGTPTSHIHLILNILEIHLLTRGWTIITVEIRHLLMEEDLGVTLQTQIQSGNIVTFHLVVCVCAIYSVVWSMGGD